MQQMPPQAGASAPQGAPEPGQLLKVAHEALMKLGAVVVQSGASPELKQKLGMLIKGIEMVGQELEGGEPAQEEKAPPMRGNAPMEAGGNPNARPMV